MYIIMYFFLIQRRVILFYIAPNMGMINNEGRNNKKKNEILTVQHIHTLVTNQFICQNMSTMVTFSNS